MCNGIGVKRSLACSYSYRFMEECKVPGMERGQVSGPSAPSRAKKEA